MDRHNVSFNISHKASSRFQANARLAMTNRKHTVWELRKETTVSTKWNISCNTALSIH